MKISEFNLLEIDVYDNDKLIFNGRVEDASEDLKQKNIVITGIDGKKVITKLTDQKIARIIYSCFFHSRKDDKLNYLRKKQHIRYMQFKNKEFRKSQLSKKWN